MNQNIVDRLAERVFNETNSAISCFTLYLGHKLDLLNSLRKERFSISVEHARVLCDRDSIAYTIPFVYWVPTLSLAMDKLLEAFRTGGGVPYSTYGREVLFAQGEGNRPMFIKDIARWIPSMPDIESKLRLKDETLLM